MEKYSQHFIKIEIKGDQRNLPKNCGNYFVMFKTGDGGFSHFPFFGDVGYNNFVYDWLTNIDYYLLPVPEPQQQEQTESADLKQYIINLLYYAYDHKKDDDKFDEWVEAEIDHIDGFFASQSPSKAVIMPTEEQLMTYFNNHTSNVVNNGYVTLKAMVRSEFLDAIKWFRSQVREVELKTELVKLLTMLERNGGNNFIDKEKIVDDYLSARKERE